MKFILLLGSLMVSVLADQAPLKNGIFFFAIFIITINVFYNNI